METVYRTEPQSIIAKYLEEEIKSHDFGGKKYSGIMAFGKEGDYQKTDAAMLPPKFYYT